MTQKKQYTAEFKFKVVLESFQRDTTIEEVCRKFGLLGHSELSQGVSRAWRHKQGACEHPWGREYLEERILQRA